MFIYAVLKDAIFFINIAALRTLSAFIMYVEFLCVIERKHSKLLCLNFILFD